MTDHTKPEFMTGAEFARHEEIAKNALAKVLNFELGISYVAARQWVDLAAEDESVRDYLRTGRPEFWVSIVRTRVHSWARG